MEKCTSLKDILYLQGAFLRSDVFEAIPPLCQRTSAIINEVFSSPDTVMTKLVLNIYQGKLEVLPHLIVCSSCMSLVLYAADNVNRFISFKEEYKILQFCSYLFTMYSLFKFQFDMTLTYRIASCL